MSFCHLYVLFYPSLKHNRKNNKHNQVQQPLVTQDDMLREYEYVDYAKIKLPPLSVLYENTRSTPNLQILEERETFFVTEKVTIERKRNWLGFIK